MLRTILGGRSVAALKDATRNLWWRFKGRRIVNPVLAPDISSVLFVCLGNICRSPFAAAIAERRHGGAGELRFGSAGLRTKPAAEPPLQARHAARAYDISLDAHRPTALTQQMVDAYDLIVVMEPWQRDAVHAQYPSTGNRVVLLSLFDDTSSGRARYVIADPFGMPAAEYADCYRRIDRAVTVLLSAACSDHKAWRPLQTPIDRPRIAVSPSLK